jgi:hypothetical protein
MSDVAESTAQVGEMILNAIQNTFGMGPDEAVAQAKATTGVSDSQIDHSDMGHVFDYMCGQPGLAPETHAFLTNASSNYHSNVNQSGSSYSGGGSGGYSGGSGGGYSGSNAQIVQQITQNYNSEEINDNHIDILGQVDGDISIDQDNDHTDVHGDGNAVNTGEGDQNAVTGDHSSGAQATDGGDAMSNSGDGAVQGGLIVGPTNTGTFTGNQVLGGDVENSPVGDGNAVGEGNTVGDGNAIGDGSTAVMGQGNVTGEGNVTGDHNAVVDNHGGTIDDSSLGFGSGNVQGDVNNEAGAANSQGGDAHGQGLDLNFGSTVNHGQGTQDTSAGEGDSTKLITQHDAQPDVATHETLTHEPEAHESTDHEALAEHLAPHVDAPAEDDHSALVGGDEHHAM